MAEITEDDLKLARQCERCPICRRARAKQKGLAYFFVRHVEKGACRPCQAYARVHGCKAWENPPNT